MLLLLGVAAVSTPNANAETTTPVPTLTSVNSMAEQIKALMEQITALQSQLATLKGEVKSVLRDSIAEGMTGEDITKLQELLATDPTIYPEGKVTGYFGPLTKQAIKRFQERHGATASGEVDSDTHSLLEEYLHEGFGDKIPQGLLRAPGIAKKIEGRFSKGCDKNLGGGNKMGPLCKKLKVSETSEKESEHKVSTSTTVLYSKVIVSVTNGTTTVKFSSTSTDFTVVVTSTNKNTVIAAIAKKLNVTVDTLDAALVKQVKEALAKALVDNSTATKATTQTSLNDAQDEIDAAQAAIDATTGSTTEAEILLDSAQVKLDAAQVKFDSKKYPAAKTLANEAIDLATKAIEAL
ncbi:MAG: hypothetical protein RLZZ230_354 [Candidatus Parcubacteria bacterium]